MKKIFEKRCKKTHVNYKVNFNGKKNSNNFKKFENSSSLIQNSSFFVMFINKGLAIVLE